MNRDDIIKMALEALESDPVSHLGLVNRKLAITALRQALEQQPSEGGDCDSPSWCKQYGKCHRKVVGAPTLANCMDEQQPADEPVAFINVEKQKLEWAKLTSWHTPTIVNLPKIPLYTASRKREWVGLTAYEIQEIYSGNQHWGNFASAIEAKLKEKNHG